MSADPTVISCIANSIGFALSERGIELDAEDALAAARRVVDQLAEAHLQEKHPEPATRVVILGRTLAEAHHWAREYLGEYPELASPLYLSAVRKSGAARGLRARRVFIAPDASFGRRFDDMLRDCRIALAKTPGADAEPVYLPWRRS